jgi:Flp pilus assembly protein TadB
VSGWLAVVSAAWAAGLWGRHRTRVPATVRPAVARSPDGWLRRRRLLWCLLAGAGAALLAPAAVGLPAGIAAAVGAWVVVARSESPEVRRERERVRRDLPLLVGLLASTLRAGVAPGDGVAVVCAALPGPAADRLGGVAARLALGMDPVQVWASLDGDPALAPLGRTMGRAQATGAPVVPAIERLADDLARRARLDVEERARAVGVKAALPLGLCLLPAFLLVGIVPLVAGLLTGLGL